MADKFLNLTGLSYFWGKIKSALNLKQDTLTAGTGIDITSNVVTNKYENLVQVNIDNIDYLYAGYISNGTGTLPPTGNTDLYLINIAGNTGDNRRWQIARARSTDDTFIRRYASNTWQKWTKVVLGYKPTDVCTFDYAVECPCLVGAGNTPNIYFSIPLGKPINDDVTGVTATSLKVYIVGVGGLVIASTELVGSTYSYALFMSKKTGTLYVRVSGLDVTRQTPVTVEVQTNSSFTFS